MESEAWYTDASQLELDLGLGTRPLAEPPSGSGNSPAELWTRSRSRSSVPTLRLLLAWILALSLVLLSLAVTWYLLSSFRLVLDMLDLISTWGSPSQGLRT